MSIVYSFNLRLFPMGNLIYFGDFYFKKLGLMGLTAETKTSVHYF